MNPVRLPKPNFACFGYHNGNGAAFEFYRATGGIYLTIMFRWPHTKFQEFGHNVAQRWRAEAALALEIS